jgi:hypothetical protein
VTTTTCACLGQRRQPGADVHGGTSADAGVDLVEHERGHRGIISDHFDGQHDPRQLAP